MTTPSELWVCFRRPPGDPPPSVLALSFMPAADEAAVEGRWGAQLVSGRAVTQEVRSEARRLYVDLVARIGATPVAGRTLREALRRDDGVSRWWFLKTSEKDVVSDDEVTYTTLLRLLCVRSVSRKHGLTAIRLVGADPAFAAALGDAAVTPASAGGLVVRAIVRGLLSRLACLTTHLGAWLLFRLRRQPPVPECAVLLEAHWDWSVTPGQDGALADRYFTDVPRLLAERGITTAWAACCEPDRALRRRSTLAGLVGEARRHPRLVLLERFLSLRDIVATSFDVCYALAYARLARTPAFRALFDVDGYDLYPVMREPLVRELWGAGVPRLELLVTATRRACERLRPRLLLTFTELFLHARALHAGARTATPPCPAWSVQHAGYSTDKLFVVVEPGRELAGRPDGCPVPAPEGVFVLGELARRIWTANGYPAERVVVTGGLRYTGVAVRDDRPARPPGAAASILIAGGIREAIDLDVCAAVTEATRDLPGVRVRLREHPLCRLSRRPGFEPFHGRIEVTTGTLDRDFADTDLLIFANSGLAEEALLRGIPAWQWLWAGVNTSPFSDLPVIPTFTSVTALRQALRDFLVGPDAQRPEREIQDLVLRQCFGPAPARAAVAVADHVAALVGGGRIGHADGGARR